MRAKFGRCLAGACTCVALLLAAEAARAQTFRYEPEPRAADYQWRYAPLDAAPRIPPPRPLRALSDPGSFDVPASRYATTSPRGRRSALRRRDDVLLTAQGEAIPPGAQIEPYNDDAPPGPPGSQTEVFYEGDYASEGDSYDYDPHLAGEPFLQEPGCGGCGHCDQCCGDCYMKRMARCFRCGLRNGAFCENLQLISGKQGFKGPVDQGLNGDFGYHFAFNWGMPIIDSIGLGYQVGGNLILSDFEGRSSPLGHRRTQFFLTTGAFHRASGDRGLQYGAVVDYLYDTFYIRQNLWQVRGELSYVFCQHEVGFWGAIHANTATQEGSFFPDEPPQTFSFEGTDQYTVFYRYQFCNGTFCRTWAGLSGYGDGIFGSDATVLISQRWGLIAAYNYLLPRNHDGVPNNVTESWNLTISLAWYPGYRRCDSWLNPYRPLFYVADNGWFFVRERD